MKFAFVNIHHNKSTTDYEWPYFRSSGQAATQKL